MLPADAFDDMIRDNIGAMLKSRGYSRDKYTFYLSRHGNWGLVNFQKSDRSTRAVVRFTVNLGVCSTMLLQFASSGRPPVKRPTIADCQWSERLGFLLLEEKRDVWWTIDADTDLQELSRDMQARIQVVAVPEVEKHLSDEALRDLWLSGVCPGLDNSYRLAYLAALLKVLGPHEKLEQVLVELRNELRGRQRPAVESLLNKIEVGKAG